MSQEKFNEARRGLILSQGMRDRLNAGGPAPQLQEEAPPSPQEQPQQEELKSEVSEAKEGGIIEKIKEYIEPKFEELKSLFTKKKEEPTEAVLKVEGTLEPNDGKEAKE